MEKQIYPVCLFVSAAKCDQIVNNTESLQVGQKKLIKSFITTTTT